jgi:YesN/AraC family two-component response regulator
MHYPYQNKSLFLLAPCDFHRFEIEEETEFTFLKFTNMYLKGIGNIPIQHQWNQGMDDLLSTASRQNGALLNSEADAEKANYLMRLIVSEWSEGKNEANETIFFLIQTLLSIIKRNRQFLPVQASQKHAAKVTDILHYIHHHIYSPELTQAEHLADTFGYSKHYLGLFFKEQTGCTLRNYINQYKLHLISNRLQYSSLSIKEISQELGFTDMSHFNKFFKNHHSLNPSEFRKQVQDRPKLRT